MPADYKSPAMSGVRAFSPAMNAVLVLASVPGTLALGPASLWASRGVLRPVLSRPVSAVRMAHAHALEPVERRFRLRSYGSPRAARATRGARAVRALAGAAGASPLGVNFIAAWLLKAVDALSTPSLPAALALNTLLATWGMLKGQQMLTNAGLLHAWILGVVLWSTLGPRGWWLCVLYLACGSAVTKVGKSRKEALGIAEGRGGRRGPENVWGSAAAATICALGCRFYPALSLALMGQRGGAVAWGLEVAYVASLATKLSDTCASEIGKAYGRTTYLITTFKKVPKGTEGAVSLEGTLAGVVGSIVIAVAAWCVGMVSAFDGLIALFAAFVATNCESVIGATAQGKVKWLTNEVVNFFNTAIGAVLAFALWRASLQLRGIVVL